MNDDDPPNNRSLNISGNYRYMGEGYYESVLRETTPTPKEALDAYVVPLCMRKAADSGIDVPPWYISNDRFEVPSLIYPINPYSRKYSVVYKEGRAKTIARSLTRNMKYPICVQRLEEDAAIREFKCVLGMTTSDEFKGLGQRVWEAFRLPLCKVRVIRDGKALLSAIEPLPLHTLTPRELRFLERGDGWRR